MCFAESESAPRFRCYSEERPITESTRQVMRFLNGTQIATFEISATELSIAYQKLSELISEANRGKKGISVIPAYDLVSMQEPLVSISAAEITASELMDLITYQVGFEWTLEEGVLLARPKKVFLEKNSESKALSE